MRLEAASSRSSTDTIADCKADVVATQVLWARWQLSRPTHLQPPAVSEV